MKISIAIPTYECYGRGWLYVSELLNSIIKQTYTDYEIVISDQSTDEKIIKTVKFYSNFMDIKLVDGRHVKRSNSPNANNAIKNCGGDIIKIMFMDDFFVSDNALSIIAERMKNKDKNWLINGCVHATSIHHLHTPMIPHYNDQIHLGRNTISSPSVLTIRNKNYFDENLVLLMDCELYKRLYKTYGNPEIVNDFLICNRSHPDQLQNSTNHLLEPEKTYCIQLYGS